MKKEGGRQIQLLTTDHCTLCNEALELMLTIPLPGWQFVTVDIVNDDALLMEFGERIPVLRTAGAQLEWPFDRDRVCAWLSDL